MEIEITKNIFLDVDKISTLKSQVNKLLDKKIEEDKIYTNIELDISYRDTLDNECFKSIPFKLDFDIDEIKPSDINLKKTDAYVVDGKGISVDCHFNIFYDDIKEVEIINIEPIIQNVDVENDDEEIVYEASNNDENKEEKIEKIKEELTLDYKNKLADNLNNRENNVSIISTKSNNNEINFLRFFDDNISSYYSIKTLECNNEQMLNTIAKEYKIPINTLLAGYDRENGKVTFRLIK